MAFGQLDGCSRRRSAKRESRRRLNLGDPPRVDPGDLARRRSGGHEAVDAWWGVPGGRGRGRGAVARRGAGAGADDGRVHIDRQPAPMAVGSARRRRDDRGRRHRDVHGCPPAWAANHDVDIDGHDRHPALRASQRRRHRLCRCRPRCRGWSGTCTFVAAGAAITSTTTSARLHGRWRARSPSERLSPRRRAARRPAGRRRGHRRPAAARRRPAAAPRPSRAAPRRPALPPRASSSPSARPARGCAAPSTSVSRAPASAWTRSCGGRLLGQRRSGRVRVGRLVRSSVGPGRVAFSLGLQAKARKVLRARRKLAVQAADHRHPPRRQPAHVDTQRDARRALRRDTAPA